MEIHFLIIMIMDFHIHIDNAESQVTTNRESCVTNRKYFFTKLNNIKLKKKEKMTKETLFNKLRDKGIFWSYSKDISYQEAGDKLLFNLGTSKRK